MSMRSDFRNRASGALMGLLLLLHLGSGLLHPCCLGGPEGAHDVGMHMAGEAAHASHAEAPMAHASDHSDNAVDDHPAGGHDSHEDDGCEGTCGLCCSTVDQVAVATPHVVPHQTLDAVPPVVVRPTDAVLPPAPAFLLPPANAPPGSSLLLG